MGRQVDSRLKQSGYLTASLAACFNFIFKSDFPAVQALAWGRVREKRDRVPDFDSDVENWRQVRCDVTDCVRVWHVAVPMAWQGKRKLAWNASGRTVDDRDDSVVAKEKAGPAVRSLIDPFSLHAYAAPLHHPPTPASFRSSLRGICSVPIRVAPSQSAHTRIQRRRHGQRTHNNTQHNIATAQFSHKCHRLRPRCTNKVFDGVQPELAFLPPSQIRQDREIRQSNLLECT